MVSSLQHTAFYRPISLQYFRQIQTFRFRFRLHLRQAEVDHPECIAPRNNSSQGRNPLAVAVGVVGKYRYLV